MTKYIGITIGPIIETMMQAENPGQLQEASFMYSLLAKKICEKIRPLVDNENEIIVPYFSTESDDADLMDIQRSKLGLFHDRVIFETDSNPEDLNSIFEEAKSEVVNERFAYLMETDREYIKEYIKEYVQIHAIQFETEENPISASESFLSSIELFKRLPNYQNSFISKVEVKVEVEEEKDYAGTKHYGDQHGGKPESYYYAILQADGDMMGGTIGQTKLSEIREKISKKMMVYAKDAGEFVKQSEGLPIYAGGDDLLAVIKPSTAFRIIEELNKIFTNSTLSFGLAIVYYKFPIDQALELSRDLLFEKAKATGNSLAIKLIKHSGATSEFIVRDQKDSCFVEKMQAIIEAKFSEDKGEEEKYYHSVAEQIYLHRTLFTTNVGEVKKLVDQEKLTNLFKNLFDNSMQATPAMQKQLGYIQELMEFANDGAIVDFDLEKFEQILQLIKFYKELGGRKHEKANQS
ncbi:type III-B CRISPR-associated protein Cas10/Cmr2 [Lactovum odontotermitis]